MMLHRETITDTMSEIAGVVATALDSEYYLAGGTALALVIGHRKSVDLDYFIAKSIDTTHLRQKIDKVFNGHTVEVVFEERDTL